MSNTPPSVAPPARSASAANGPTQQQPQPAQQPAPPPPPPPPAAAAPPAPAAAAVAAAAVPPAAAEKVEVVDKVEPEALPADIPVIPHPDTVVDSLIYRFFPERDPAHPWATHGDAIRYLMSYYEFVDLAHVAHLYRDSTPSARRLKQAILHHVCKGRSYTALWDTIIEMFHEAEVSHQTRSSMPEMEELLAMPRERERKRVAIDPSTPVYAPNGE